MTETPDAPVAGRAAGPIAAQMARLFARAMSDAIAPFHLAPAQYVVLRELWRLEGLTQSELARRLEVEQATMANTLKRMVRDGLIRREPHPDDSRAQCIRLTDRGRLLEKPAKAAVKRVNARAVAPLSRKEQKRFVDLSRRVVGALKSERLAASPNASQLNIHAAREQPARDDVDA